VVHFSLTIHHMFCAQLWRRNVCHVACCFVLSLQMCGEGPQKLGFTIPLMEPLPPQYYIRLVSDNWLQVGSGGGGCTL
jgi:hypothetical protein